MLSIDDVIAQLQTLITPISVAENVPLATARDRVLFEDVFAPIALPPFNSSAMDGYAVKAANCIEAGAALGVVGTSLAGTPYNGKVPDHAAVQIFTGACVPDSTDAVVLQEDVDRSGNTIVIRESIKLGDNIRYIGHDVQQGERLLARGTKLAAFEITWLAACGVDSISVTRLIKVALFSTGDELQDVGTPLKYGQIYDSNRAALKELLGSKPVEIVDLGRLPDDPNAIERAISAVSSSVDLVVTSGGVSVGDADYVRAVVEKLGELTFWNVALKPGKPIAVGKLGTAWFLGLPGNPVSTVVTYLLFVARLIDTLAGMATTEPLTLPAKLTQALRHARGRREYQRGVLFRHEGAVLVRPAEDQSSNRLSTLAKANCLIIVPETRDSLAKGESVEILLLPREANHLVVGSID